MPRTKSVCNCVLILTACIEPKGMSFTKLQDPEIRKHQYIEAMKFYLQHTDMNILFVENSGHDVSSEFATEIENGRVEVLTFSGNDYPRALGKGYGEMILLEHAVKHAGLVQQADFIFKVSGRYKVRNIAKFFLQYQTDNQPEILADLQRFYTMADARMWGATPQFIRDCLLQKKEKVNDTAGYYFEHALADAILEYIIQDHRFALFKYLPRYTAISGTDGTPYKDSWWFWYPRNLRHQFRYRCAKHY
jgi:hypothetical protein